MIFINSFIPWIGGKSQLRKTIIALFPEEKPERYIEGFGGAGWVLLGADKHAELEVFNDLDNNLINLYRCIKYHCSELQRQLIDETLFWVPNSRQLFLNYREQLDMPGLTDIQRAARYFYVIRASYGADRRSYGCNKKSMVGSIERLPEIQQRLKDVVIENRDFESLLKTYDRSKALFYLDPPYVAAEKHYGNFPSEDHIRLADAVKKLKGKAIISYNDHPFVRELYNGFTIHEISRANNLALKNKNTPRQYHEIIITNY